MADERGVAAAVETRFPRTAAHKHVVDEAPHLLDPPTGPGPNLRRRVIEHRNAVPLGPPGDPPVEARIVDQHHGVGPMMAKVAIGPAGQIQETCAGSAARARTTSRPAPSGRRAVRSRPRPFAGRRSRRHSMSGSAAATRRIRLAPCRSPLGSPTEKKIFMRVLLAVERCGRFDLEMG